MMTSAVSKALKCAVLVAGGLANVQASEPTAVPRVTINVSPNGSDQSSGQSQDAGVDGPVATVGRAIEILRNLKAQGTAATQYAISLAPGTYRITAPLMLDARMSGDVSAPTLIAGQSATGVRITGAVALTRAEPELPAEIASRIPAASRPHVLAYDLRKNGVDSWLGPQIHGFDTVPVQNPNELFVDGNPQVLASWPKDGYTSITQVPGGNNGRQFSIADNHPGTWHDIGDVWVLGYFFYDWADANIPLATRAADGSTLTLTAAPKFGIRTGQRVRFQNIPEELDRPGYYYFDYRHGVVYVWVDKPERAQVELSVAPQLMQLSGIQHLRIENLSLDDVRGDLVDTNGVSDVIFSGLILRNSGKEGLHLNGSSSGITKSSIENTGGTGVTLVGGDRQTLTPGDLYVSHSTFAGFGRNYRTYQPAVELGGVGGHVEHNRIHQGPHQAIKFSGNDHVIAYNDIYDVVLETGDAGAIYGGRDWTGRGTVIQYNYLHNIHGVGQAGATGVYIDDQGSGTTIRSNVFDQVHRAVLLGGGLDNLVQGNMIVRCPTSVYLDARGLGWQKQQSGDPSSFLQVEARAVPYDKPQYLKRYPQLGGLVKDGLGIPRRNSIQGNILVRSGTVSLDMSPDIAALQQIGSNLSDNTPGFVVAPALDLPQSPPASAFQLSPQSKAFSTGFKPIPLSEIGP